MLVTSPEVRRVAAIIGCIAAGILAGAGSVSADDRLTARHSEGLLLHPSLEVAARDQAAPFTREQAETAAAGSIVKFGSRVRVRVSTLRASVTGTVVSLDRNDLTLDVDDGLLKIPVSSIEALELGVGRRRQWLKGLVAGALGGVGIGFVEPVDPQRCGPDVYCSRGQAVGVSMISLGLLGTGVGALIKTDRWLSVETRELARSLEPRSDAGADAARNPPLMPAGGVVSAFSQLSGRVGPGDRIRVLDSAGQVSKGTITALSPSSLELVGAGTRRTFAEDDVRTVSHLRMDSLKNGAWWGFGTVGGFFTLMAVPTYDPPDYHLIPQYALIAGSVGAAIGAGVDALIRPSTEVIYARPGRASTTLTLAPLVTGDRKGMLLTLGF